MSISASIDAIERLETRERLNAERRYAFQRMLAATDEVLATLEELNVRGVVDLPADLARSIRPALAELPTACLAPLVGGKVQDVLDSIFEVQERLFCWRDPGYKPDDEAEPEKIPADTDDRIVAVSCRRPGIAASALTRCFPSALQPHVARRLPELAAEGRLKAVVGAPHKPGPMVTRYWPVVAALEGEG